MRMAWRYCYVPLSVSLHTQEQGLPVAWLHYASGSLAALPSLAPMMTETTFQAAAGRIVVGVGFEVKYFSSAGAPMIIGRGVSFSRHFRGVSRAIGSHHK